MFAWYVNGSQVYWSVYLCVCVHVCVCACVCVGVYVCVSLCFISLVYGPFPLPFQMRTLSTLNREQRTFYSAVVEKLNRSLKTDRRIFVVTERRFYRMDENFQMKKKRPMDIEHVTGISLSAGVDQGIVIHCPVSWWLCVCVCVCVCMCACVRVCVCVCVCVCSSWDRCVCCFTFPLNLACSLHHCRQSMVETVCATSQRTDPQPNWLPPSATPIDGTPDVTFLSTCLTQSIIKLPVKRKP